MAAVDIVFGLKITDGLSHLTHLISAMNRAGVCTRHPDFERISVNAYTVELAGANREKSELEVILLPSPKLLRFFADEIEKKLP